MITPGGGIRELETRQQLLRVGIQAVRAGDKTRGRDLLEQVVRADESNAAAWLWLSRALDDPAERLTALQNAARLNPQNEVMRSELQELRRQLGIREASPPDVASGRIMPPEASSVSSSREQLPATESWWSYEPYQCIYCGKHTQIDDSTCPHCGRKLLAAGKWEEAPFQRRLLLPLGMIFQGTVWQLLGPAAAVALTLGVDLELLVRLARLPFMDQVLGAFAGWSESTALILAAATFVRLMVWGVLVWMFLTDLELGYLVVVVVVLLDLLWHSWFYLWQQYPTVVMLAVDGVLEVWVGVLALAALFSRSQARVRLTLQIDSDAKGAMLLHRRGREYLAQGKTALAAIHLAKALAHSPATLSLYRDLAEAQMQLGRYAHALNTIQDGLERAPDDSELLKLRTVAQQRVLSDRAGQGRLR